MTSSNGTHATPGEDDMPVIYTTDEEGKQHCFQMMDELEVEGQRYALLLYLGEDEESEKEGDKPEKAEHVHGEGCSHDDDDDDEDSADEEFVIMRVVMQDGDKIFETIDDDDEFERVLSYVENLTEEYEEGE